MEQETKQQPAAMVIFDPIRADIEKIKSESALVVFDYNSEKGITGARSYIHKLRGKKGDVERARKAEKSYALEYGRKVDALAGELTMALDSMIAVHQAPLDEIAKREEERKAKHAAAVMRITSYRPAADTAALIQSGRITAAELKARLAEVEAIAIGPELQEYMAQSVTAKELAASELRKMAELNNAAAAAIEAGLKR